jgi:hypothetical protein
MNKLTHGIDRDFTVVPNQVLKDKRLSFKAKGLWITIISLPEGWNFSVTGMAALATEKESAIKRAMLELVEYKYLKWDKTTDGLGRFSVVVTTLLPDILPHGKKPQGKKPQGKIGHYKERTDKERTDKERTLSLATQVASVSDKPITGVKTLKQAFEELTTELGYSKNVTTTQDRLKKLRVRINRLGYPAILQAAKVLRTDEYMQGGGTNTSGKRYATIDYLLRNDENVTKWAEQDYAPQTTNNTGYPKDVIPLTAEQRRKYAGIE